ncbi:MAG: DNA-deoxyinosine glycosylase [Sphingorhabdus sp.]
MQDIAPLQSFPPVYNDLTTVMVIGSLPGTVSLAAGEYYAHPRNHFWPIMSALTGKELTSLQYEDRLSEILLRGIGLWDSVRTASRRGSSDANICGHDSNDLGQLLAGLSKLKLLVFNGQTAARFGRQSLPAAPPLDVAVMPSSSPAYTLSLPRKIAAWRLVETYLHPTGPGAPY